MTDSAHYVMLLLLTFCPVSDCPSDRYESPADRQFLGSMGYSRKDGELQPPPLIVGRLGHDGHEIQQRHELWPAELSSPNGASHISTSDWLLVVASAMLLSIMLGLASLGLASLVRLEGISRYDGWSCDDTYDDSIVNRRIGGPWSLALRSVMGNVRSRNEDAGAAFSIGKLQLIFIADGCGGMPHGDLASRTAIQAAAEKSRDLSEYGETDPRVYVSDAFDAAASALRERGDDLKIVSLEGGMRTTLIAIAATSSEYVYQYIGDGGIHILRTDGSEQSLLEPHRVSGISNGLAASLGPTPHGEPKMGSVPRRAGDLLIVGTDGVFDHIPAQFAKDILRLSIVAKGNFDEVLEKCLASMAVANDERGAFICDDNMTLAVMGDGEQPRLSARFWISSCK